MNTVSDQTFFRKAVAYYTQNRPYFYALLRPHELTLFHRVFPSFQRPLLDFGCGDGFFAKFLAEGSPIDYGVDYDPAILPEAQHVYAQVIRSDTTSIPLNDEAVRTIFSNSVFEHLHQPAPMIHELFRILQSGGKLYTTVTTSAWEEALFGAKLLGSPYRAWFRKVQRHHAWQSCAAWQTLFVNAGFRVTNTTGYLDVNSVRKIECYHYLSLPVFFAKMAFGTWNHPLTRLINAPFAALTAPQPLHTTDAATAPCVLFELEKSLSS